MPVIADRENEDFAQAVAYGFTPVAAAEELGFSISKLEAMRLAEAPEVKVRIQELIASQQFDTSNEHLRVAKQLEMDREFAYQLGNPAAAINASVQRAKLLGVFIERSENINQVAVTSRKELSDTEWEQVYGEENGGQK